jgi:hypothetical protein
MKLVEVARAQSPSEFSLAFAAMESVALLGPSRNSAERANLEFASIVMARPPLRSPFLKARNCRTM